MVSGDIVASDIRDEIKSSGKNSILNSFKIADQTPSPLYPKGEFLMLTTAYNIKQFILMHCYLKLTTRLGPPPPSILN